MTGEIEDILSERAPWLADAVIEEIDEGRTNRNFKAIRGPEAYFLRLGEDIPAHGISRTAEALAVRTAAEQGVAPQVHEASEGLLITDFISGTPLRLGQGRFDRFLLERIAGVLARLHATTPPAGLPEFDLKETCRRYLDFVMPPGDIDPDREVLVGMIEAIPMLPVVCMVHGDLVPENFIDDGKRLWLVDWEYAGTAHPAVDLAMVSANFELSDDETEALVKAHGGANPAVVAQLKQAVQVREALWCMAQLKIGGPQGDLENYTLLCLSRLGLGRHRRPAHSPSHGARTDRFYDVVVAGAGVIGCAIARDLSRLDITSAIVEAGSDFGDGASKGNSALLCSGFDTPADTLERQLVVRGYQRYLQEAPELGLPIHKIGAMMIAWSDVEAETVREEYKRALQEGFNSGMLLDPGQVYQREPNLAPGVRAALLVPDECIVDPFSTPLAYLMDAVANDVDYLPGTPIAEAERADDVWILTTANGPIRARIVVNAAGLYSDLLDTRAGFGGFSIRPRRGQYLLFDKTASGLLNTIALPTPTPSTRGVLITPTVFGNILVGPTAEDVGSPSDNQVTTEGLRKLQEVVRQVLPPLEQHEVITNFAGMRPASDKPEYRFFNRLEEGWFTAAGVRSTGLSAALGIAEHIVARVAEALPAKRKNAPLYPVSVPQLDSRREPGWTCGRTSDRYREIVCHCEQVSLGEIEAAMASPIPPRSLKALRRRTRVMFGRCQGFYCGARVRSLFEAAGEKA